MALEKDNILEVMDLKTYFFSKEERVPAVDGVSFSVRPGEILGLIGESGCGKSVTAQSILRIVPSPGRIVGGSILYHRIDAGHEDVVDLTRMDPKGDKIRSIRWKEIAMIFQEPMVSFGPLHTIGNQIAEAIQIHSPFIRTSEARNMVVKLLMDVGVPRPEKLVDAYPHQFSGGMLQRAMIAMALSCSPRLLIADEATTYLDVTIQAQILELLKELHEKKRMSILLITHNLAVVAQLAERVVVMYLGKIVESATMQTVFRDPLHPYTKGLWRSIPRVDGELSPLVPIPGSVGSHREELKGCVFAPRCEVVMPTICHVGGDPPTVEVAPGHFVSCHHYPKPQSAGD